MRQRTVLFAWEMGLGLGHAQAIRRLAARLRKRGVRTVAAVRDLFPAAGLAADGCEVLQAPIWPERASFKVAGMAEILANFGLGDATRLALMLAAWRGLIDHVKPDLLVADYSPAATLAARGRVPVVQSAASFCLPPRTLEAFPALIERPPSGLDQGAMLASINGCMRKAGLPPIARLGDVFAGEIEFVQTFPILDIYDGLRPGPAVAPLVEDVPGRPAGGSNIFAYLNGTAARSPAIADALRPLGSRLHLFAPELHGGKLVADLAESGAVILNNMRPLPERLATACLFIHHGNGAAVAESLALGVPQLALPPDLEKFLNSDRMRKAGVGAAFPIMRQTCKVTAGDILRLAEDGRIAQRAAELGGIHRTILRDDPLGRLENACISLLDC